MSLDKINTIGIIGAGAMGSGIAQVAAIANHKVLIYDTNRDSLTKATTTIEKSLSYLLEKGKIDVQAKENILSNIEFVNDLNKFSIVDLVIEAIVEILKVKQDLFTQLESIVSNECVLATNTSSLSIASISSSCANPQRVIGIHFFNPAHIMPLVEIIPGICTDDSIVNICDQLIAKWGKIPVRTKDTPGFIVNRVARSFYGESIRIYEEGIADFATIDWALKSIGGFKMGPFELMDFIGNDVNYRVTESVWEQFFYDPRFKPSLTQKRLFEAKLFGKKSGRGYYNYGQVAIEPTKDEEIGQEIVDRVLAMLINEAVDSVYLNIASAKDIDLAMTKGVNYPKGLLAWGKEIGWEKILNDIYYLSENYQEDRYRPSFLLKKLAAGSAELNFN